MSYKYKILKDKPLAFYMLEEVRSGDSTDYTNLLSQFATYQDLKDNGISYATLSGMPVWDSSGNGFNGFATDASDHELMPIIAGAIRGTEVKPITSLQYPVKGIASKEYSDDEFSIEIWASLPKTTGGLLKIVGDIDNNIGIFYENGTVTFAVQGQSISETLDVTEALHIVGVFTSNSISLYIDGALRQEKLLNNFLFTNESISFKSGNSVDTFVIDGLAFYKKALTPSQINSHYLDGNVETPTSQIVNTDSGILFSLNLKKTKSVYEYNYPESSPWINFANENVKLSADQSSIYIEKTETPTEKTFTFTDSVIVPNYLDIVSSLIYYNDDSYGTTIEVKIDGQPWVECKNAMPLPYFNKNENNFVDTLDIRVTMYSSDTTKYFPRLKNIKILFFADKDCYSDNSGERIFSEYDYGLPHMNHLNLSYCKMNGISMMDGHGFTTDHQDNVKTLEMIFTPNGESNVLFSTDNALYGWDTLGNIYSNNVVSVHINAIDVTSDTNISDHFVNGYPYHVVIVLEDGVGTNIKFNQNQDDSEYGGNNIYSNIALYDYELTEDEIHNHYLLYTDRYAHTINDSFFSIVEDSNGQDNTAFYIIERDLLATNI